MLTVATYAWALFAGVGPAPAIVPFPRSKWFSVGEERVWFAIGLVAVFFTFSGLSVFWGWCLDRGEETRRRVELSAGWMVLLSIPMGLGFLPMLGIASAVPTWGDVGFFFAVAGWLVSLAWALWPGPAEESRGGLAFVVFLATVFAFVFSTLAILQGQALHVPHGDSGMYEEHLWNLIHGKGFRSQIDDGRLFLGEHFQFIHVFLLPIYVFYPTLATLQVLECLAIASGAIAIFLLCRTKHLGAWGVWLSAAYLSYFPLHYLILEVTWKAFRPETFGVPILLWGLLAVERRRWGMAMTLFVLSWTAKEDYAITTSMIGVWMSLRAVREWFENRRPSGEHCFDVDRQANVGFFSGLVLAVGSAAFLFAVLTWFIPYFRGGVPHYTAYFGDLGSSPTEVVSKLASDPSLISSRLFTPAHWEFVILMLMPMGFLAILSPARFLVAAPTFGYLMLSSREELSQPWFHFHAPLVPILFWATTGGIASIRRRVSAGWMTQWVFVLCVLTSVGYARSSMGWRFYDPLYSIPRGTTPAGEYFQPMGDYAPDVYRPSDRSRSFDIAFKLVPATDRVAATDYVRNRFTHHAAAHVYPEQKKHAGIESVDAIVIDRTEAWWGRENNPDKELLAALEDRLQPPGEVNVRGKAFRIVHHSPYWFVLRAREKMDQQMTGSE
jgi:uncharacterized membrane protein